MSELLFDRRALTRAVNSPDVKVRKRLLIDTFWPREITETFSEKADFIVEEGENGIATFRYVGQEARTIQTKKESLKSFDMPYTSEKKQLTAKELQKNFSLNGIYSSNFRDVADAKRRRMNRELSFLKNRVMRLEEWVAARLLSAGKFTYNELGNHVEVDLGLPAALTPALAGTSRWGQADANIERDLQGAADVIDEYAGDGAGSLILGKTAARLFLEDEKVLKQLDRRHVNAGELVRDVSSRYLGNLFGLETYRYSHKYMKHDGTADWMIPDNVAIVLAENIIDDNERLFGLVPDVDVTFSGMVYADSWAEKDPSVRWLRAQSRPLPIPKRVGSWVAITVA